MQQPDWSAYRREFPIFRERTFINSCSKGALSIRVYRAVADYLNTWMTDGSPWEDQWMATYARARERTARFLGVQQGDVALMPSVSAAVSGLASALDYSDRPRIVTTRLDFPTVGHIWLAQRKRGAEIVFVEPDEQGSLPLERFEQLVDDRTLLVSVPHVSFLNGANQPVAQLARLAHRHGAYLLVDAYQSAGVVPFQPGNLEADVAVGGFLKYLLGDSGLAYLYVRPGLSGGLIPTALGWFSQSNPVALDPTRLSFHEGAARFEGGTPAVGAAYAAAAGLEVLAGVGAPAVHQRVAYLTKQFAAACQSEGLRVLTPVESLGHTPLVSVDAYDPKEVVQELAAHGVIVSWRGSGVRFSFHFYNDDGDIAATLEALRAIRDAKPGLFGADSVGIDG